MKIKLSLPVLPMLLLVCGDSARAQQSVCFHKARHIECHFADGKLVNYDTDASAEYYNIPPYMTFRTKDGALHSIIGNCEVICRP